MKHWFLLEDGVPLPARKVKERKPRLPMYPFHAMAVGQSFVVPPEKRKAISAAATKARKDLGIKLVTRSVENGIRVWRTA